MLLQSLTWVCVSHAGRFLQSVRDELVPRSQHVKYVKKAPENWPNYRVPLYLLIYKLRFREWQGESRLTDVFPNWMEIQTAHLFTPCFAPSAFALLLVWVLWVTSQLASSCLRSRRPMAFDPGEEAVNSVSSLPAQTQGGRSLEYIIQLEVTRAVVCATSLVNTQTGLLYIPETDAEVCSASQTDAHSRVMGYI